MLGDLALLVLLAAVAQLLPDAPLEEPLASLTAHGTVVSTYNKNYKYNMFKYRGKHMGNVQSFPSFPLCKQLLVIFSIPPVSLMKLNRF